MSPIKTILRELVALFIDDGSLVMGVVVWVVAVALALRGSLFSGGTGAVLLGVGLAALLAENILRYARSSASNSRQIH